MEEKITALKMVANKKIPLGIIITAYQYTYRDRTDILKALPDSLADVIDYMNGFLK